MTISLVTPQMGLAKFFKNYDSNIAAFIDSLFTICLGRWNKAIDWLYTSRGSFQFLTMYAWLCINTGTLSWGHCMPLMTWWAIDSIDYKGWIYAVQPWAISPASVYIMPTKTCNLVVTIDTFVWRCYNAC